MKPFHVLAKPMGPLCNLSCRYCFYLEKDGLFPQEHKWRMSDDVLEAYVQQYIAGQDAPVVSFTWQGGEPTLLGVGFFRRVVELQRRYANGKTIENALQTNGILLDDEWGAFLAGERFLVGLSLDGPRELHDRWRVDRGGAGSFERVMRGLDVLRRRGVEFNILTCVHRENAERPLDVYRFLRGEGCRFLQFIPIVERAGPDSPELAPWSLLPEQLGRFLSAVFAEWVRRDVGRVFVQAFDVALESWVGREPSLCVARESCGWAMAIEHNGDVYSCDHYVDPDHWLGNVRQESLATMRDSELQRDFGRRKADLPPRCLACDVRFACRGGCPKDRLTAERPGEPPLNHLCPSYASFFRFVDPYMRFMAVELEAERAPAGVMEWARGRTFERAGKTKPARDAFCPCGSGKRYRRCCGAAARR
jgi:uncharacterized protein